MRNLDGFESNSGLQGTASENRRIQRRWVIPSLQGFIRYVLIRLHWTHSNRAT